ncbi:hypothetical protein BJV82DRAFT_613179 [Fennellomyces sp. T-0311]|nr:hypothetical protein BJV82DRAFT_613179 [Fennellomyces sp. T-0311]
MTVSNGGSGDVFVEFMRTVSDFKALLVQNATSTDNALQAFQENVQKELGEIKRSIADLSSSLREMHSQLEEELTARVGSLDDLPEYPQIDPKRNPLANRKIERNIMHPLVNDEGSPRQFTWELYSLLGEKVFKSEWQPAYLTTFKKNITPYADELAIKLRQKHNLGSGTTWRDLGKLQQRQANLVLEEHIKDAFPLTACAGYWGARLLMVRAFQRTKKDKKGRFSNGWYRFLHDLTSVWGISEKKVAKTTNSGGTPSGSGATNPSGASNECLEASSPGGEVPIDDSDFASPDDGLLVDHGFLHSEDIYEAIKQVQTAYGLEDDPNEVNEDGHSKHRVESSDEETFLANERGYICDTESLDCKLSSEEEFESDSSLSTKDKAKKAGKPRAKGKQVAKGKGKQLVKGTQVDEGEQDTESSDEKIEHTAKNLLFRNGQQSHSYSSTSTLRSTNKEAYAAILARAKDKITRGLKSRVPRKATASPTAGESQVSSVIKKRGRPKKSKGDSETDMGTQPKRPRGRPPNRNNRCSLNNDSVLSMTTQQTNI